MWEKMAIQIVALTQNRSLNGRAASAAPGKSAGIATVGAAAATPTAMYPQGPSRSYRRSGTRRQRAQRIQNGE